MNETYSWEDLRLFLAVSRAGGLAAAAQLTSLSPPTLGRRMTELERALGLTLFTRHRLGYDLTKAGRELATRAEAVELQAVAIDRWRAARDPRTVVRIAAGDWTSRFLAQRAASLAGPGEGPGVEILTGIGLTDLNRREANLGIRNRRPDLAGLAGRRLGRVEFAVFAAPELLARRPEARDQRRYALPDWIALAPQSTSVPSSVWLEGKLQCQPRLRCTAPRNLLDAALAGNGLCVLPCFVGDAESGLERAGEPIPELAHEQWLVSHDDDRHNREIRSVIERLVQLFRDHRDLFAGIAGALVKPPRPAPKARR